MRSAQYASLAFRTAPQSRETNSRMPRVITRSLYRHWVYDAPFAAELRTLSLGR